ncbi:hypothetical protein [Pararobbsia alpina]|uniref:hypothetical protein n=1 Tax=Pararobbsia alpina TaxID=621374 RepID=UPI001FE78F23|nr:hypothetical protein [Pararobbsia alpina]
MRTVEGNGQASGLVRFRERELHAGWPVIIGGHQHLPVQCHAALVTGIEGHQHDRTCEPHALLLLDPAGDDPRLTGFNARVEYRPGEVLLYHSTGAACAVTPEGALSIRTNGAHTRA